MHPRAAAACLGGLLVGCNALFGHDPGVGVANDAGAPADGGASSSLPDATTPLDSGGFGGTGGAIDGACDASSCAGPDTFPACGSSACAEGILASGLRQAVGLAMDDTYTYWIDGDAAEILRVPTQGGNVNVLARSQANAVAIVADGLSVYWVVGAMGTIGEVRQIPRAGGAIRVVATNQVQPTNIAVDDTAVYWTAGSGASGRVLRGQKKTADLGASLYVETAIGTATGLTVDTDSAYLADPVMGTIARMPLHAPCSWGAPCLRPIAIEEAHPQLPFAYGGNVYWTNSGNASVVRGPFDGDCNQPPCDEVLGKNQATPGMVIADDQGVYWINAGTAPTFADGILLRGQFDSFEMLVVTELAQGQASLAAMAMTQDTIVWLDRGSPPTFADGTLHRMAKP